MVKQRVLGFDVSSTTTGYCILDIDLELKTIEYIDSYYFKPIKKGSIYERLDHTKKEVNKILSKYKPDVIAIEELIQFMKFSTAKTVISLVSFNRTVGMESYYYLKHAPMEFNVNSMRHSLKKLKGLTELPPKEDWPEIVADLLKIDFPWEFDKKNRKIVENYDRADAIVVATYTSNVLLGNIKVPIKAKKKKKSKVVAPGGPAKVKKVK